MDLSGFNKLRYALHSKDYKKITSRANKIGRMRIFVKCTNVMWSTAAKFLGFQ